MGFYGFRRAMIRVVAIVCVEFYAKRGYLLTDLAREQRRTLEARMRFASARVLWNRLGNIK